MYSGFLHQKSSTMYKNLTKLQSNTTTATQPLTQIYLGRQPRQSSFNDLAANTYPRCLSHVSGNSKDTMSEWTI